MKINRKIVYIVAAAVVALVVIICAVTCSVSKKATIAFYGIEESQASGIQDTITELSQKNGKKQICRFITFDETKPLAQQAGKADLIITMNGLEANNVLENLKKKNTGVKKDVISEATSSIKGVGKTASNGKLILVPLLSDNYEIDIDKTVLEETGMKTITSWNDIERFARLAQKKIKRPVVFAGGDGEFAVSMFGALAESFDGYDTYAKAVETAKNSYDKKENAEDNGIKIARSLAEKDSSPLYNTIKRFTIWYSDGLINPDSFNMSDKDVSAFMQAKMAPIVLMNLSTHRKVEHNTIERYSSIYFPSQITANNRSFTAPTVCAIPMKRNSKAVKIINLMIASDGQEKLSRATGLAPVLAHCRTPDHQADDARFWIAATNAPLAGLGADICDSKELANSVAKTFFGMARTAQ